MKTPYRFITLLLIPCQLLSAQELRPTLEARQAGNDASSPMLFTAQALALGPIASIREGLNRAAAHLTEAMSRLRRGNRKPITGAQADAAARGASSPDSKHAEPQPRLEFPIVGAEKKDRPLGDLGWRALAAAGIHTVGEVIQYSEKDLVAFGVPRMGINKLRHRLAVDDQVHLVGDTSYTVSAENPLTRDLPLPGELADSLERHDATLHQLRLHTQQRLNPLLGRRRATALAKALQDRETPLNEPIPFERLREMDPSEIGIDQLALRAGPINRFSDAYLFTLADVLDCTEAQLLRIPRLGRKSVDDLKELLKSLGYHLVQNPAERLQNPRYVREGARQPSPPAMVHSMSGEIQPSVEKGVPAMQEKEPGAVETQSRQSPLSAQAVRRIQTRLSRMERDLKLLEKSFRNYTERNFRITSFELEQFEGGLWDLATEIDKPGQGIELLPDLLSKWQTLSKAYENLVARYHLRAARAKLGPGSHSEDLHGLIFLGTGPVGWTLLSMGLLMGLLNGTPWHQNLGGSWWKDQLYDFIAGLPNVYVLASEVLRRITARHSPAGISVYSSLSAA